MKKVLVVMAMVMGVGCMSAIAAEASVNAVAVCQASQDEYKKIEVTEIPDVVKEASVAEKDGTKTYKLVIATAEGTESTVTFNDKGEEVK